MCTFPSQTIALRATQLSQVIADTSVPSLISVKRSLLQRRILSTAPTDKALSGEGHLDLPCCLAIQCPLHPRSTPRRYLQETCHDEFSPPSPQPPNRRSVRDPVFCSSSAKHRCRTDAVAASVSCHWERVPDTCSASRFRKRPECEGLRPRQDRCPIPASTGRSHYRMPVGYPARRLCNRLRRAVSLSSAEDVRVRIEHPLDVDSTVILAAGVPSEKLAAGSTHVRNDTPVGTTLKVVMMAPATARAQCMQAVCAAIVRRSGSNPGQRNSAHRGATAPSYQLMQINTALILLLRVSTARNGTIVADEQEQGKQPRLPMKGNYYVYAFAIANRWVEAVPGSRRIWPSPRQVLACTCHCVSCAARVPCFHYATGPA